MYTQITLIKLINISKIKDFVVNQDTKGIMEFLKILLKLKKIMQYHTFDFIINRLCKFKNSSKDKNKPKKTLFNISRVRNIIKNLHE